METVQSLKFDPDSEEADLRAYLGGSYDRARLEGHQLALEQEAAAAGSEDQLYRTSRAYLYDLTVFAMSGTKVPYLDMLMRRIAPGARVLDYGCGIGSDGLLLLEAGYRVEFADFDNPSTAYLRWRLANRGLDAPVHDLDKGVPDGFDAVYSFDVIEHAPDPFAFVEELENRAKLVEINLLEFDPNEQELHHELPIADLVDRAAARRLESYRILHGSSHVILYRPELVGSFVKLRNRVRVRATQLRHGKTTTGRSQPRHGSTHPQ